MLRSTQSGLFFESFAASLFRNLNDRTYCTVTLKVLNLGNIKPVDYHSQLDKSIN
jgi:hypothetical protein